MNETRIDRAAASNACAPSPDVTQNPLPAAQSTGLADKVDRRTLPMRLAFSIVGMIFCGLGAGSLLFSRLGVDPGSVFIDGLGHRYGLTYGSMAAIFNLVILALVFIVDRRYIHLSSILAIGVIGYTADLTLYLHQLTWGGFPSLLGRSFIMLIGILLIALGIATYTRARLGVAALDITAEVLADKFKTRYFYMRILVDAVFFACGVYFKGAWGIGTLLIVLFLGPLVSSIRPAIDRLAQRLIPTV